MISGKVIEMEGHAEAVQFLHALVSNLMPVHETEDALTQCFQDQDDSIGTVHLYNMITSAVLSLHTLQEQPNHMSATNAIKGLGNLLGDVIHMIGSCDIQRTTNLLAFETAQATLLSTDHFNFATQSLSINAYDILPLLRGIKNAWENQNPRMAGDSLAELIKGIDTQDALGAP